MTELTGMTCEEITTWVKNQGYPAFRGKQIFRWIHQGADFEEMTNLPAAAGTGPGALQLGRRHPA